MPSARLIRSGVCLVAFIVVPGLWSSSSHAQYSGYYLELSGGPSEAEVKFLPPTSEASQASELEAESDMVSLTTGLRFNDNISVEVGYTDYGKFSGPATLRDTIYFLELDEVTQEQNILVADGVITGEGEYETTAFTASLIGSLPLSRRWSLFGKLGLSAWDVESEFMGTFTYTGEVQGQERVRADFSDGGSSFFYSAGLIYRFNLSYGIKLEYQEAKLESDVFSSDADVQSMSLGLRLYF